MEFQERMSNTSYQRGVEDIKKAGLNPGLMYQHAGASTPGGTSATMGNSAAAGASSAQSAVSAMSTAANTELTKAQTGMYRAQTLAQIEEIKARTASATASANAVNTMLPANLEQTQAQTSHTRAQQSRLQNEWPYIMKNLESEFQLKSASAESARQSTRNRSIEQRLLELTLPEAKANAWFYSTPYGSRIAPFMGSASQGLDIIRKLESILPR